MAVYKFHEITRLIPPILHHDESVKVRLNALKKGFLIVAICDRLGRGSAITRPAPIPGNAARKMAFDFRNQSV